MRDATERIIAGSGCSGRHGLAIALTGHYERTDQTKADTYARRETTDGGLKSWSALKQQHFHPPAKHEEVMHLIEVITQIEIASRESTWSVTCEELA